MNEKLENFIDFAREGENSRSTRRIFMYTQRMHGVIRSKLRV